jgi:hypothetical protein
VRGIRLLISWLWRRPIRSTFSKVSPASLFRSKLISILFG